MDKIRVKNIDDLFKAATREFKITESELRSKKRNREIVFIRQSMMHIIYTNMNRYSLKGIGIEFGGMNHATVLHARDRISDAIISPNHDSGLYNTYKRLKDAVYFEDDAEDFNPSIKCTVDSLEIMFKQWDNMKGMSFSNKLDVIKAIHFTI